MPLFEWEKFRSYADHELLYKIECDALSDESIEAIAKIIAHEHRFRAVYGVPTGGNRLAAALARYETPGVGLALIVDDVLTTGTSMEEARRKLGLSLQEVFGIVIFARGSLPSWVKCLCEVSAWARF
ncbi:MAG TPA: hypothetical protein VMV50_00890 [Candidatus Paceibacterota bacterium]|nr:hypothetical protein [Candidatus Paceibacterota bacterium]